MERNSGVDKELNSSNGVVANETQSSVRGQVPLGSEHAYSHGETNLGAREANTSGTRNVPNEVQDVRGSLEPRECLQNRHVYGDYYRFDRGDHDYVNQRRRFLPVYHHPREIKSFMCDDDTSDDEYIYPDFSSSCKRLLRQNTHINRSVPQNSDGHGDMNHFANENDRQRRGNGALYHEAPLQVMPKRVKEWSVNPFDGKQDWDSYWAQFQLVARYNGWPPALQAMHLVKALVGGARSILADMSVEHMEDLPKLVAALERRYRPREKVPAYRALFNGRRQRPKESAQEFAEELRLLALKAFPTESAEGRETRLIDKFLEGLQDNDMRKHVVFQHPESIEGAVSIATELEAYDEAQRVNGVKKPKDCERSFALTESETNWVKSLEKKIGQLSLEFQSTRRTVSSLNEQMTGRANRSQFNKKDTNRKNLSEVVCYKCGLNGHFKRDCPNNAPEFRHNGDRQSGN